MILTGPEIEREWRNGRIWISPYHTDQLQPNSYDFRLGPELLVYTEEVLEVRSNQGSAAAPGELHPHVHPRSVNVHAHGGVPTLEVDPQPQPSHHLSSHGPLHVGAAEIVGAVALAGNPKAGGKLQPGQVHARDHLDDLLHPAGQHERARGHHDPVEARQALQGLHRSPAPNGGR